MIKINVSIFYDKWWKNFLFDAMYTMGTQQWFQLGAARRQAHINQLLTPYHITYNSKKELLTFHDDMYYTWFILRWS